MPVSKSKREARTYLAGTNDRRFGEGTRLRRDRVLVAGAIGDRKVLDELGSAEACTWHDGRTLADPAHKNPYRAGE